MTRYPLSTHTPNTDLILRDCIAYVRILFHFIQHLPILYIYLLIDRVSIISHESPIYLLPLTSPLFLETITA